MSSHMKQLVLVACLSVFVVTSYGQLGKDAMRRALSQNPIFSHKREKAALIPQNVNIALPLSDPHVQEQWISGKVAMNRPAAQTRPVKIEPIHRPSARSLPVKAEASTNGRGPAVQQKTAGRSITAGKPTRPQSMVLGQIAPTKTGLPQPVPVLPRRPASLTTPQKPTQKSMSHTMNKPTAMQSNVRTTVNKPTSVRNRPAARIATTAQEADSQQECSFHIPSFLLPDPDPSHIDSSQSCPSFLLPGPRINPDLVNLMVEHWTGVQHRSTPKLGSVKSQITQVEFEQKCLIPALRAHVLGEPVCRTRALKVYLEWLLYLRQRLFNI